MNAQPQMLARTPRSPYQRALSAISCAALVGVSIACIAWAWPLAWAPLVSMQRLDAYKQWTGYILVVVLGFDVSLALIKRRLRQGGALRGLQIAHRSMGVLMLVLLVLHAGFTHQGFLSFAFMVMLLVVVAGAALNTLPGRFMGFLGPWAISIHIAAAVLLAALAVLHLWFVFRYAS
jgi:methionine sulfoxide reductase heme-binding subunit